MATTQEAENIIVRLIGDGGSYMRMLSTAQAATARMSTTLDRATESSGNVGVGMRRFALQAMGAMGPLVGIVSSIGAAFKGVQLAGASEMMESNFKVMLGSASKAKEMTASLQQFAAETPLNMGDLSKFTKGLLQAGVTMGDIIPTIRMLGDAALGDSNKLQGLAYAFGQIKNLGRLMGQELNQMINAGFNPLSEISRTTGKSMGDLKQAMERGEITFEMVENAFKTATGAGGRFQDGMKEASTTLQGLFSTMQDDIDGFLREMGKTIIEHFKLKEALAMVSRAAQALTVAFKEMHPAFKFLIVGAAIVMGVVAALEMMWMIAVFAAPALSSIKFILATMLGPIGLITAAVAVLGGAWVIHVGGINNAMAILKAELLALKERIFDAFENGANGVIAFLRRNNELRRTLIGVATGILVVTVAVKALTFVWGVLSAVMAILKIKQILAIALWVGITAVILAAKVALGLYNAGMFLYTVASMGAAAASAVLSALMLVAKGGTWLLNAALTVTNILLGAIPILIGAVAIAITAVLIGVALTPLIGAVWAAYAAWQTLMKALESIPTDYGPLKAISSTFEGWGRILSTVFKVMRTDSALAFEILEQAAKITINKIRDMWRPLWEFIQEGWKAVARGMAYELKVRFQQATKTIKIQTLGVMADPIERARKQARVDVVSERYSKEGLQLTKDALKEAVDNFKMPVKSLWERIPELADAHKLKTMLDKADNVIKNSAINKLLTDAGNAAADAAMAAATSVETNQGAAVKKHVEHALKQTENFRAGTAAAFWRRQEYANQLSEIKAKSPTANPATSAAIKSEIHLKNIDAKLAKTIDKPAFNIGIANLEGS